jgi:hypothetical protein
LRVRSERVLLFHLAFWPLGNFSLSLLGHAKGSKCSLLGSESCHSGIKSE